jgi:tetratricopeptide (TPR) repeat protein
VVPKVRQAVLFGALLLLVGVMAAWWGIRAWTTQSVPENRVSILDEDFSEAKFYATASQEELVDLAGDEVKSLLERFPNSAAAANVKANRDFLLNDMVAAEETWKSALALEPRNPDALFGLANLVFQAGKYDEAIALCEGLLRTNPGNPRVPLLLADSFMNNGHADLAVLVLEQHILSEPTSVQAYEMLGSAQLAVGSYNKAIDCFTHALEFAPNSKDSYYGLGQAHAALGDKVKAAEAMQQFAKLANSSSQSTTIEAQAFEDRDQAAHVAAQAYLDSALVYKTAGDLPAAQSRILKALRLQPNVVAWLEELQRVLQLQGSRLQAADVGERLVSLLPKDVRHWLTLGSLYAELEQPEPAITAFRKAIELAPDHPECQAAKSIIQRLK